ncbi:ribosomal RNA-processing protein 1 [[Candida] railenensis]|uniref:Ribosomal RNA-processing protein 1 n=1 Tax=[Candida] railenensis TaxID=45579 RepID=A0A9P0VW50_9ASCO|nr:ribosomal RNA-processing protein 1 [[Candida] railenensis]
MSTSAFVKKLASNDRPTRDAAFESLKKYLSSKSNSKTLTLLDLEKLWRGLYFSMWFCDRPLPQQKLAEKLGELFSTVVPANQFNNFVEAFWVVMNIEWPNIDQWRIDKFYMLIRRVVRHCFIYLKNSNWEEQKIKEYNAILRKLPLSGDKSVSVALPYHLCDIYIDEIEVVIFESVEEDDEEEEENEEVSAKKLAIVEETPITTLLEPFAELQKQALLKTLREKCKEEVLEDSRLKTWGLVENEESDESEGEDGEKGEESESDDEWNGFA